MDTATFFARVLPRAGNKVLAELVPFKDKKTGEVRSGWRYTTYQSFDAMAEAVAQFDAQNRTVYHACNAFGDWYEDPATNKKRLRTQVNVVACRALYDDIDVGKEGCYATKKEAFEAVKGFLAETGLPMPLVVDSGGGLHLYWPLTEDIGRAEWLDLAMLKRSLVRHFRLRVDPACDLDSARVLRPVGSTNRKRDPHKVVTAKNDATPTSPARLREIMEDYINAHNVQQVKTAAGQVRGNAFGAALDHDYPPSYPEIVATHCAVVGWFRDTGAPEEPVWHKCIGLLKHCENGEAAIHEWSSKYQGYDVGETQEKIDLWPHGPTTCEAMRAIAPALCADCKHTVKSPIQLGHAEETKPAEPEKIVEDTTPAVELPVEDLVKQVWPQNFVVRDGAMHRVVINPADGTVEHVRFCDTQFYAVGLEKNEEHTWDIEVEYVSAYGQKRRFIMSAADVASSDKTASALAAHTVFVYGKNGKAMATEIIRQMAVGLQAYKREVVVENAFGWSGNGDSFVIGTTSINKDSEGPVKLSDNVARGGMAKDYGVAGTKHDWVNLVDEVYNRPGAEAFQFAFLVAAASPLIDLVGIDGFHGIPVAYTGTGGRGKTTTCELACSIWGRGQHFKQSANTDGATINALLTKTSIFRHLPFVMDEMTGQKTEDISGMLYALSNGTTKSRLVSSGQFATKELRWDLFTFITGNMDITGLLMNLDHYRADAVSVRCFEIKVPDDFNETVFAGVNFKQKVDVELRSNYGIVGRELIRFYMRNRDNIIKNVHKLRQAYNPSTADETRERFYIDLICFALVAGHAMKKLDLIRFDLDAIKKWAFATVKSLRRSRNECRYTDDEMIGMMLSSLHDRTITTKKISSLKFDSAREVVLTVPRDDPAARLATDDRRFIVTAKAINDWARENGVTPRYMRDSLDRLGYLRVVKGRDEYGAFNFRLGQGTNMALGLARCYELNYDKVFGYEVAGDGGNVVQLVAPTCSDPVDNSQDQTAISA